MVLKHEGSIRNTGDPGTNIGVQGPTHSRSELRPQVTLKQVMRNPKLTKSINALKFWVLHF